MGHGAFANPLPLFWLSAASPDAERVGAVPGAQLRKVYVTLPPHGAEAVLPPRPDPGVKVTERASASAGDVFSLCPGRFLRSSVCVCVCLHGRHLNTRVCCLRLEGAPRLARPLERHYHWNKQQLSSDVLRALVPLSDRSFCVGRGWILLSTFTLTNLQIPLIPALLVYFNVFEFVYQGFKVFSSYLCVSVIIKGTSSRRWTALTLASTAAS